GNNSKKTARLLVCGQFRLTNTERRIVSHGLRNDDWRRRRTLSWKKIRNDSDNATQKCHDSRDCADYLLHAPPPHSKSTLLRPFSRPVRRAHQTSNSLSSRIERQMLHHNAIIASRQSVVDDIGV